MKVSEYLFVLFVYFVGNAARVHLSPLKKPQSSSWTLNTKAGKFQENLWCCICRSDEGLKLETLAFKLFTVATLRHQLSW